MEELKKKLTKNLSQYSRCPGREFNPERPEYEAGILTTPLRRTVASL
jgi:hypothetical protein